MEMMKTFLTFFSLISAPFVMSLERKRNKYLAKEWMMKTFLRENKNKNKLKFYKKMKKKKKTFSFPSHLLFA